MKSPRRTFIKTMVGGAAGIAIGATSGSTASCASPFAPVLRTLRLKTNIM